MEAVGAAFRNDVYDAADCSPKLRAVAAVDDPKFFYRVLGGRRFLNARGSRHVIRPIDRHKVVMNILSRKG